LFNILDISIQYMMNDMGMVNLIAGSMNEKNIISIKNIITFILSNGKYFPE